MIKYFFQLVLGLALLFAFYMIYIHVISVLSVPIGVIYGLFILLILLGVFWNLLVIIKDVVVSIFKKDDSRNEKGFKKHF